MKVYFNSNYWGKHTREHAGNEIPVNREFLWADRLWRIPAVYSCAKGLVVDLCVKVPSEKIEAFIKRWNIDQGISELTLEEHEQLDRENPLEIDFDLEASINGKESRKSRGCAISWIPYDGMREQNEDIQEELMNYYACDRSFGWRFIRAYFPWNTVRKPKLKTISFLFKERPAAYQGEHFVTEDFKEEMREIEFTHPVSKQKHKLLLLQCEGNTIPEESLRLREDMYMPDTYKALTYSVIPDLPQREFQIRDCARGDKPRIKENSTASSGFSSVGIIGGADGVSAIFIAGKASNDQKKYAACSSLYFDPVPKVEWRMVFYVKENEDIYQEIVF